MSDRPLDDAPAGRGDQAQALDVAELLEKVRLYESILDGITDMVVVRGQDGLLRYANKAFADFHGRQVDQLVGTLGPCHDGVPCRGPDAASDERAERASSTIMSSRQGTS